MWSAMSSAGAKRMSISCCDGPTSWWWYSTGCPIRLERADRLVAQLRRRVHRRHREVAALVERLGALVVLEEEVLELGADVERVEAHRLHALERAPKHVARVALVRLAVGRDDVADHPRRPSSRPRAAGMSWNVSGSGIATMSRLLDRVEARDRRAVEAHPVVERALELARRDREALQMPLEVGEPEQHELDLLLLDALEDVLAGVLARRRPVLRLDLRHESLLENAKSPRRDRRARGIVAYRTAGVYLRLK